MMRRLATILVIILWLPQPLWAGETALRTLLTGSDSRGWEAVGRLDFAQRAFCTGALIAPDLVLTAAHCLFDTANGQPFEVSKMTFLAGHRNGRSNAQSRIDRAIAHPEFDPKQSASIGRATHDLALLRLESPIRKSLIVPFETQRRPRKSAEVGVVSYARGRSESAAVQDVCHVLARRSGMLILSCDVDFGSSGAPVFVMGQDGVARIVSVISAKAEINGRHVSLGTDLEKPLLDLMALMAHQETDFNAEAAPVRVMRVGEHDSSGGARFVRP